MTPSHKVAPLASSSRYGRRLIGSAKVGVALITGSLAAGMAGYMLTEGLGLLDAFLNASMILAGMGPLHNPLSAAGKIFAGVYALYCGVAALGIAAITFAPVLHRTLHRFHIEDSADPAK